MKRLTASLVFTLISIVGMVALSYAAGDKMASGSKTVEGDLLKIEGEFYTVHDTAGHEVRVHVDKTSKLEGTFKSGDKVEVQVTDKGHALSMKHMTGAGGEMVAPGAKTVEGDLLKIEGEFYTVHDMAGHETRVHVDKTSKLEGTFKTGDKVKIHVTDKGHALSVNRVQPAK